MAGHLRKLTSRKVAHLRISKSLSAALYCTWSYATSQTSKFVLNFFTENNCVRRRAFGNEGAKLNIQRYAFMQNRTYRIRYRDVMRVQIIRKDNVVFDFSSKRISCPSEKSSKPISTHSSSPQNNSHSIHHP
ncbi:hypothetical protein BDZ91DRAFT_32993 [Kalaharituber pfeilii]|nr:hypothetical protein BDZ91DRAFT_32993 [Kalaharituber pfeilii]